MLLSVMDSFVNIREQRTRAHTHLGLLGRTRRWIILIQIQC